LLLISYTPGSYYKSYIIYQSTISLIGINFLPLLIFNVFFTNTYRNEIYNYTIYKDVQQKFISAILEEMEALFIKIALQPMMESALLIHY
jgi:hypothetical protein